MYWKITRKTLVAWLVTLLSCLALPLILKTENNVQAFAENDTSMNQVRAELDPNLYAPSFGQLSAIKFKKSLTYEMGGVALDSAGSVWSWGYNLYGKSGVRAYADGTRLNPDGATNGYLGGMKKIEFFDENNIQIVDITAGFRSIMGLDSLGNVYTWGRGSYGEMGNGTLNGTNPIPVKVTSLPRISKIFSSNDYEGTSHFAIDTTGKLWVWGSNAYSKLGISGGVMTSKPVSVEIPSMPGEIVAIASGDMQTHILNSEGDIWYVGDRAGGRLGNGSGGSSASVFRKLVKPAGMSKVIDINTGRWTTIVLDDNHTVWQWGDVRGPTTEIVWTPKKVEIDVNDDTANFNKGYTPIPQRVFSGWINYYFIDQYGRPWSWGSGMNYGFGIDNAYVYSTSVRKKKAVQLPKVMGDGTTQVNLIDPRTPRYLSNPANPSGKLPNDAYGIYGINNLNPTIYDHKYLLRDEAGNYLDEAGNKYRYNRTNTGGRVAGFFYRLNNAGQMTNQTGVPSIKPDEKPWIELAGQDIPQVASISAVYEAFTMVDVDGNIYKWGVTGSGTMAWGWDVEPEFDYVSLNKRNGLYDRYTYEVMFMRGAPRLPQLDINMTSELAKNYVNRVDDPKETTIDISVKIPPVIKSPQLGLTVESQLHEARAIIMPYDQGDPTISLTAPTEEEVAEALVNPNYRMIDLIAQEGWKKPVKNLSEVTWLELSTGISIKQNSVVWIVTDHTAYDQNNHLQSVVRKVFDNYYQEIDFSHKGIENGKATQEIYPDNYENIEKITVDGIADKLGFPLDVAGEIIGTPENPPTYGYDEVKVSRLSNEQLEEVEENFTKYWQWVEPQTQSKNYHLNGIDQPNNQDITQGAGELGVTDNYTHPFNYEKNPKGYALIFYLGIDETGNKIDAFNMASEEVRKGIELARQAPDLSEEQLMAKAYKMLDGEVPTNFPLELTNMQDLDNEGRAKFTVPFSDEGNTVQTLVFQYLPPFGQLNVRQVIVNETPKVNLPRQGYVTLTPSNFNDSQMNLFAKSQLTKDQKEYSAYKVSLSRERLIFQAGMILPQYYEFLGYKLNAENGNYDESNLINEAEIKIDFSSQREYWLTIYLTPKTNAPDNYTWGVALNKFGEISAGK